MDTERRIRLLCTFLVVAVLALALILALAVCGGTPDDGAPEETTRQSLADLLLGDLLSDQIYLETVDWGEDTTAEPDTSAGGDETQDEVEQAVGMNGGLGGSELSGTAENTVVLNLYSEIEDRIYLKMQSFGDYTGKGFAGAEAYPELLNGVSADFLPAFVMDRSAKEGVFLLEIEPLLPVSVLPYYALGREGISPTSDILVEGNEDTRHTVFYRHSAAYSETAVPDEVRQYEAAYRDFVYGQYLTIDETTRTYMQELAEREGFDPQDPDVIQKVARYIKSAASYNKEYDEGLDEASNIAVAFLETYKEGVCRHYAAAATLLYRALGIPARYTVGFAANVTPGETCPVVMSQAHAWVEVYVDGFGWQCVEVTGSLNNGSGENGERIAVELKPVFMDKQYDGTPLIHNGQLSGFEMFEEAGYTYQATVTHDIITIGITATSIKSVTIFDATGQDVTDQFAIMTLRNRIHIYYESFTFSSVSKTKVYDSIPLAMSAERDGTGYIDVSLDEGDLPAGMTWEMTPSGEQTSVGKSAASFRVTLWLNGEDVTALYRVLCRYGILEITPAPLTLTAASAEKPYDGTPLTAPSSTFDANQLMKGHYIAEVDYEGERTNVGRSGNVITRVVIRNQAGEDVTSNYAIETIDGVLRVRP